MKLYLFALMSIFSVLIKSQNILLNKDQSKPKYYKEVSIWFDGSKLSDSKIDGVIYIKNNTKYFCLEDFLQGNPINAKTFGVMADGTTDDTKALQKAFDISSKYGLTLYLPFGTMITSSDLYIDLNNKTNRRLRIIGSGISNTIIKNINNNTTNALKITGDYFNNLDLKDFRIERELSTPNPTGKTGLNIEKQVYASLENIEVIRFNTGIEINDVSTLYMKNVNARYCGTGISFSRLNNGVTNPNLIEMHSCILTSNEKWGLSFVNGHSINIYNGLFEDNGLGGINFSYDNTNGGVGLNLTGSYFEGNRGVDVYLKTTGSGVHNFVGNTFNRVSDQKFTQNNIVFEVAKSNNITEENVLMMQGNGFLATGSYVATPNRSAIKVISNGNKKIKVVDYNNYKSINDIPKYSDELQVLKYNK